MKLVTYDLDGMSRLGAVHDGKVADLATLAGSPDERLRSARGFLEGGDAALERARALLDAAVARGESGAWPMLETLKLKAPIPDPRKLFALAGNYGEHIREGGGVVVPKEQQVPQVFMKPSTCVIGHEEAIRLPGPICTSVDYEGELGVVIGRTCRCVSPDVALDYVAGYTNVNDVSGRRLDVGVQREVSPRGRFFDWLIGKWFDTFAPIGPYLVLKDEVPDPQALTLTLRVNGQVRQNTSTAQMVFSVVEIVAWISQFLTLEPGDIIATGTPSGVGAVTQTYLQVGDVVELEIAGLGVLRNRVAQPLDLAFRTQP